MDQYALQSYFKSMCNSYYIAHNQLKRLDRRIKDTKTSKREKNELVEKRKNWGRKLYMMISEIQNLVDELEDSSIIITSEAEVIAFIALFDEDCVFDFKVINTSEEALKAFPTEEKMCREFLNAYLKSDYDAMKKVHTTYF